MSQTQIFEVVGILKRHSSTLSSLLLNTMASDDGSDLASPAATSDLVVPTIFARTSDSDSVHNNPPSSTGLSSLPGYEKVDWTRLKGYQVPSNGFNDESKIWTNGWRLWHADTER